MPERYTYRDVEVEWAMSRLYPYGSSERDSIDELFVAVRKLENHLQQLGDTKPGSLAYWWLIRDSAELVWEVNRAASVVQLISPELSSMVAKYLPPRPM